MASAERIDVEGARERVRSGDALLVCAYEDEAKCRGFGLEEALTLAQLESREVSRDREIIFFCA